jgi:hypothetical protein
MLWQDIEHLVPYRHQWHVEVVVDGCRLVRPDGDLLRRRVALALPTLDGYDHEDLDDAVAGFLRLSARHLVIQGRARYEVYYRDVENTPSRRRRRSGPAVPEGEDERSIALALLTEGTYWHLPGVYWQRVPAMASDQSARSSWLPARSVATFQLPWRQRHMVGRAVRAMHVADRTSPTATRLVSRAQQERLPYDISEHERQHRTALAKATAPIGYTVRELITTDRTSPYQMYRWLRFRAFQVELRDRVMAQLNAVLADLSDALGARIQLALDGVLTAEQVRALEDDLRLGTRPTLEILTQVLEG